MEHKKGFWKGFLIGGICFLVVGALGVLGMTRLIKALSERSRDYSKEAALTSAEATPGTSDITETFTRPATQESPQGTTPAPGVLPYYIDRQEDSFLNMMAAIVKLVENNQVMEYDLAGMELAAQKAFVENLGGRWEDFEKAQPSYAADARIKERTDYPFLNRLGELKDLAFERGLAAEGETKEAEISTYRAFVEAMEDPYAGFLTAEEWEETQESSSGIYHGIGVQISQDLEKLTCTVTAVFSTSPAREAGILVGDIIRKVDGIDVTQMQISELVKFVRGPEGTRVTIGIYRPALDQEMEFVCERRKIEVDTVYSEMLTKDIGLLRLTEFDEVSLTQMTNALKSLSSQGMKKLVLDLRGNPGGLLSTVLEMADLFLDGGQMIFKMDYKDGEVYTEKTHTRASFTGDMVVLVNGGSASAAEVLTGILQDYSRAVIMGEKTYGKGIVQSFFDLPENNMLKLTIAHYYSPTGRDFHGNGIMPDIEAVDDVLTEQDELVELAVRQLQ